MTDRRDFWRAGRIWNAKVLQIGRIQNTEERRQKKREAVSSSDTVLALAKGAYAKFSLRHAPSVTDFRYNVLNALLIKFCNTVVTPSLVEGSRLARSLGQEGECRDSSTPLRSSSKVLTRTARLNARLREQNDVVCHMLGVSRG